MVIDSEGDPDLTPDEVIITVENRPPVANLGPDRYVNPGDRVELSATDSIDPDGDANLEYVWAQISGSPSVALTTMEARAVLTAPMTSAALTFRVYVYDSFGGHDPELSTDDVTVYVGDLSEVYFPHITRYYCDPGGPSYKPDLVVQKTTITPDNVQVQISNQGCAPVTDWFYVDVYVNPDPQASITVDDNWWALNDQAGIKWQVTPSGDLDGLWEGYVVAELAPGDVLVLNQADRLKTHGRSRVPQDGSPPAPWPSGTVVRAQVDTHLGGRVPELNEGNNLSGLATCP